jgi:hypothetical protein
MTDPMTIAALHGAAIASLADAVKRMKRVIDAECGPRYLVDEATEDLQAAERALLRAAGMIGESRTAGKVRGENG